MQHHAWQKDAVVVSDDAVLASWPCGKILPRCRADFTLRAKKSGPAACRTWAYYMTRYKAKIMLLVPKEKIFALWLVKSA
jgi:hypothetical protein